jgi:hypothetical protein
MQLEETHLSAKVRATRHIARNVQVHNELVYLLASVNT